MNDCNDFLKFVMQKKNHKKHLNFLKDPFTRLLLDMVLPQVTLQIVISQGHVVNPAFAVRNPNALDSGAIVVYLLGDKFKKEFKMAYLSLSRTV